MVEVRNLIFDYPELRALNNISFTIRSGAITALVGPNGSGKTTLMRCLAALSRPYSGSVCIDGFDTVRDPHQVHLKTGYLKDLFGMYDDLTVRQSLLFTAYSRLPSSTDREAAADSAARKTGSDRFMDQRISTLSRGMRQRVGIAQAIVHNPKFLVLDEPASGLDPEGRYELSTLMLALRDSGITIMVSSHILAELGDYSSEMLVLRSGTVVEHRPLTGVSFNQNLKTMEIVVATDTGSWTERISAIQGVTALNAEGNKLLITIDVSICPPGTLLQQLIGLGAAIESFTEERVDLQQAYLHTITRKS